MTKFLLIIVGLLVTTSGLAGINDNKQRADVIRTSMWFSGDADFAIMKAPEKWKNEPGVILAKEITFAYKKEALSPRLIANRTVHLRVRIQSDKVLTEYSQFRIQGSDISYYLTTNVYAGFKIIKSDGTQVEVPMQQAVLEKETINGNAQEAFKLAIPNLEIGDIIDYYIVNEQSINLGSAKYYAFDPVVLNLTNTLPTFKSKISFDVLRRCYLNLKCLNGAPAFSQTNADNDSHFALETSDLEGVPETELIFPYRQLPAVKFKVTYASSFMAGLIPGFIGEPGSIKSSVGLEEIPPFMKAVFSYAGTSNLKSAMKSRIKNPNDFEAIAKDAFYTFRNSTYVQFAEMDLITGRQPNPERSTFYLAVALSQYYKTKKIPHDFVIGIPRQVSSIDNLVFEDELTFMLRVRTSNPFYIGRINNNAMIGEIDPDLEGEDVLIANGLQELSNWKLRKEKIPADDPGKHKVQATYTLQLTDLNEGAADLSARILASGLSRAPLQNLFMDYYDYREEESKRYTMKGLDNLKTSNRVQAEKLKQDYLGSKTENVHKKLKESLESELDFPIEEASGLTIEQTGRFDTSPDFIFTYNAKVKGLTRKVGPNYLMDIGKLIEKQSPVPKEEKLHNFDLYLPSPHEFVYNVEVQIPEGYTVKGLEGLEVNLDNATGSFSAKAEVRENKIVMQVHKTFKLNFVPKSQWPSLVAFMESATLYNGKQILFEKK